MVTFIIRRLIGTIFLLIVVSMITFAIFFLIPRLAGQTTLQLAAQYVGRNPTKQAILQVERQLGLADPLYLQYGRFLKGIVLGAHYRARPTVTWTAVAVSDSGVDDGIELTLSAQRLLLFG